jgi:hypothetical protein
VNAASFFGFVQALYNFFAASTHRWNILTGTITGGVVIKSLSSTRWSARADATRALKESFAEIRSALLQLAEDGDQTTTTRSEASCLASQMQDFELALLCMLWDSILQRFNATSKNLQKVEIDLSTCVSLYDSLLSFVQSIRKDEAFQRYEEKARLIVEDHSYQAEHKRIRKTKRGFGEVDNEVVLSPRLKIPNSDISSNPGFLVDGTNTKKGSVRQPGTIV